MLADDLVSDMYLKLMNKTVWNDYFVAITIKNLFLDHIRKEKKTTSLVYYDKQTAPKFEPNDEQQAILDAFEEQDWVRQYLLKERASGRSLRYIEKRYNINYGYVHRQTTEAKKEILNGRTKRQKD